MSNQEQITAQVFDTSLGTRTFALISVVALAATIMAAPAMPAQTFTVLHTFTGGSDGENPIAGLTEDAAGNLNGTVEYGGNLSCTVSGCGMVYKVVPHGTAWLTTPIYTFHGTPDGANPTGRVVFGPDGSL